jgi:hypothetical protein
MKKLQSFVGYLWAVLALVIAPATFLGYNYFSRTLADTTGMKINPRFSGGEVVEVVDHGAYKTSVHRPVFDALIGQTKEGFVQIRWDPAAGLPSVIHEGIDFNQDGREDFIITLNTSTGEASLSKSNPEVIALEKSYHLRDGWAVRVLLKRKI